MLTVLFAATFSYGGLALSPGVTGPDIRWRDLDQPLGDVVRVGWITGPDSVNRTDERWNLYGTDLGHPILHDDDLYLVFGDTWGADGSEGDDWRSNGIARMASADPRDGVEIAEMVTDTTGQSAELLASQKISGIEKTVIPTYGISTGDEMVLHYMSVRRWLDNGRWDVDHAGFATSIDDGRTWSIEPEATLPGDGGFAQVAMVDDDDYVMIYGIPSGRLGGVRLARAQRDDLVDLGSWEYWDGDGWGDRVADAALVVNGPVGEFSVQWNDHLGRWVLLGFDASVGAIMLRTAPQPTGPWSDAVLVTSAERFPRLYAPYIIAGTDTGDDLYFTMSQFGPYQVALMKLRLSSVGLVDIDGSGAGDLAAVVAEESPA